MSTLHPTTPCIVNLACTGAIPTKSMNPHVPLSHDEIVEDVARCMELGVQMVHLHARDADGVQTGDPDYYGRMVESVRGLPGGDELIIGITTTGRKDPDYEARSRVLALDGAGKPDMASLTLSSINFLHSASVNEPDTIRRLAARMLERGIKPELEVFDLGMANFIGVLMSDGLLEPPLYVNVLLGNISGAQVDLNQLAALMSAIPEGALVSLAGLGRFQLQANTLGLVAADGVRVGLEDNIWMDAERTTQATNAELVARITRIASEMDRPLFTRRELRTALALDRG
jgi:uncharacterized protein (DUF849 family)